MRSLLLCAITSFVWMIASVSSASPAESWGVSTRLMQREAAGYAIEAWSPVVWQRARLGITFTANDYEQFSGRKRYDVFAQDIGLGFRGDGNLVAPVGMNAGLIIGYATYEQVAEKLVNDVPEKSYWFADLRYGVTLIPQAVDGQQQSTSEIEIGVGYRWNFFAEQYVRTAGSILLPTQRIYPYLGVNMYF